jgi:hypothetical protein
MDREAVLEAGFLLMSVGFLAGFGLLVGGRLLGDTARRRRSGEAVPSAGSIPAERHQLLSPSAR